MARSRLCKIGTIHSRTNNLLRAGAMREEDRPLWLDIYEAFPPKDEPRYDRPESKIPIREIFYEEDTIRAKFHRDHQNLPFVRLDNTSYLTQTQKFIAAYQQLKKDGVTESELYPTAVSRIVEKTFAPKSDKSEATQDDRPHATVTDKPKQQKLNIDVTNIFKD